MLTNAKGKVKFKGYYRSTKSINHNVIYYNTYNIPELKNTTISQKDVCVKYDVDILGKVHGENDGKGIKCGEPLSLLREKS